MPDLETLPPAVQQALQTRAFGKHREETFRAVVEHDLPWLHWLYRQKRAQGELTTSPGDLKLTLLCQYFPLGIGDAAEKELAQMKADAQPIEVAAPKRVTQHAWCTCCSGPMRAGDGDNWDGLCPGCADSVSEYMDAHKVGRDEAIAAVKPNLSRKIEDGITGRGDCGSTAVIDIKLSFIINLALDPGEVLSGPKLVRALYENAAEAARLNLPDYQRDDCWTTEIKPMHIDDFEMIELKPDRPEADGDGGVSGGAGKGPL